MIHLVKSIARLPGLGDLTQFKALYAQFLLHDHLLILQKKIN